MKLVASVFIAVVCLLAVPATALSAEYTVDSTLDEPDASVGVAGCLTAGLKCTLRAAIQESNASTSVDDTIKFAAAFNGELADTISIGASFPAITDQVHVDGDGGGQCTTAAAGVLGPCVGVEKTGGGLGIVVENADGVTIDGLALTGATYGIGVFSGSASFTARDNWLGVKLDGSAGANNTGIFLDPDSNGAMIGGKASADRNVFANSGFEGLDIEGADDADVLGNYFGVKPDGVAAAANGKNIEITDTVAFAATGNEVGATIEAPALGTAVCDGGCNVIAGGGLSTGIDLQGNGGNEAPATGPTTVHGNYVGLGADGSTVRANGTFDILSYESEDTTIGGPANGDANFIAGGGIGIYHQDGKGFEAVGNVIGSSPTGDVTAPGQGIFVYCLNLGTGGVDPVVVNGNVLRMEGGAIGIEAKFGNVDITENFIEGAGPGIYATGDPPGAGTLIEDNVIGESVTNGILLESDFNIVVHNSIYGSGAAGIRIQDPTTLPLVITTGNLIGGDTKGDENTIRESGGDAIEIVDESGNTEEDSQNAVARNHGDENAGLFIDLVGNANGGILPPTFAISQQSSASGGGAQAGATIRVFRKAESAPGEIESFLGEATADASGKWKVAYSTKIPAGTRVAATQTSVEGGTSELAFATTTADPSEICALPEGCDKGPTIIVDPVCAFTRGKCRWPETMITRGPKAKTRATQVKFRFTSDMPGSTFECKLDKKPFKKCKSPKKYKNLKPGKHVFRVRAIKDGVVDPSPAKRKFRILD